MGKLPDGNPAEALRRIPGMAAQVDQDEGRCIVIRDVDSSLNNVTLNGLNVGTPSEQGNRGIALDSIPADLISRLEVVKAVTPDMDANAIGGSVNIVTQSALDRPEGFAYGNHSASVGPDLASVPCFALLVSRAARTRGPALQPKDVWRRQ